MSGLERSLEQIEGDYWGDAPAEATRLVETAHLLRRRPVRELSVEDLRLLIGQQIGVGVLVPVALALLADDPLAEGHFYPGDLLAAVLRLPDDYWAEHPEQRERLITTLDAVPAGEDDAGVRVEIAAFRSAY